MQTSAQRTDLAQLVARVFSERLGRNVRAEYLEQVILVRDGFCWGWSYRYQELVATYICGERHIHVAQRQDEQDETTLIPLPSEHRAAA